MVEPDVAIFLATNEKQVFGNVDRRPTFQRDEPDAYGLPRGQR